MDAPWFSAKAGFDGVKEFLDDIIGLYVSLKREEW
jgi:hypothetical protein